MASRCSDLQIELWPVDRLIPYARNSRIHSDEQVAQASTPACTATSSASGYADTTLAGNTTAYRYYRLTTGTINGSTSPTEFEFTVDYNPGDFTVETATGKQINNGGAVDYSAAVHTLPVRVGPIASMPGACTQGELYFATDAGTPGKNLYFCTATNTWTATP